ncbi:hypothetical protein K505DRAFT_325240 [Melanomma pulvis-pyrius CBS 109.77]|uniref:Uncharacterized protein n=1 Tax=Melanomma pulvis-pyrius CBS 109.77 TaxID=1314802 RepID=A0A6A6XCR0_9PLEO|nr:hypothetical protein K505DRAFT_325240 [Melanomma pulvis-pyrius CBS 109.77]
MAPPPTPAANAATYAQNSSQVSTAGSLLQAMENLQERLNNAAIVLEDPNAGTQVLSPLPVARTLRMFEESVALIQQDFEVHDQKRVDQVLTANATAARQFQSRDGSEPGGPLMETRIKQEEQQTEEHIPNHPTNNSYRQAMEALNAIEADHSLKTPALQIGSMEDITSLKIKINRMFSETLDVVLQHYRGLARANEENQTDGHMDLDQGGVEQPDNNTYITRLAHQEALNALDSKYLAQLNELQLRHAAHISSLDADAKIYFDLITQLKSRNEHMIELCLLNFYYLCSIGGVRGYLWR